MKLSELLLEMPTLIPDIDWHELNDLTKNQALYNQLINDKFKRSIFKINDHVIVYKKRTKFFSLDTELKKVTYFMRYKVDTNRTIGMFVWQSLVWSDAGMPYTLGIPEKIFFEQLLPQFHTILTDSEQTWKGRRFWERRIADAFVKNLYVYFYNLYTHELIQIHNNNEFNNITQQYDVWGYDKSHGLKRMIISDKKLI